MRHSAIPVIAIASALFGAVPATAQEGVPSSDAVYGPVDPEDPYYELRRRAPPAQPTPVETPPSLPAAETERTSDPQGVQIAEPDSSPATTSAPTPAARETRAAASSPVAVAEGDSPPAADPVAPDTAPAPQDADAAPLPASPNEPSPERPRLAEPQDPAAAGTPWRTLIALLILAALVLAGGFVFLATRRTKGDAEHEPALHEPEPEQQSPPNVVTASEPEARSPSEPAPVANLTPQTSQNTNEREEAPLAPAVVAFASSPSRQRETRGQIVRYDMFGLPVREVAPPPV